MKAALMERDLKEVQQKAAGVESSYGRDLLDLAIAARYISELSADGLLLDISMTIIRNWRRSSGPSCPPPWPRLHEHVFPGRRVRRRTRARPRRADSFSVALRSRSGKTCTHSTAKGGSASRPKNNAGHSGRGRLAPHLLHAQNRLELLPIGNALRIALTGSSLLANLN